MSEPLAAARRSVDRAEQQWRNLPLRTRLTTAATVAATVAIVAVVAVAYVAVRHELRIQIDHQLKRQSHDVRLVPTVGPIRPRVLVHTGAGDIGGYSQIVNAAGQAAGDGQRLPINAADVQVARTGQGSVWRDATYAGQHVRMLTIPIPNFVSGYAVQLALPLTAVDNQLHVLRIAFAILALGGLLLTIVLSWAAVRRVTRPVRVLTETAEQIAATRDLTVRIASESNDELGRLASSFNTMLDALERAVSAQRQLVTDASHELRTPLASLRTNVEVLNDLDRLPADQRRAVLAGIVTQLDELTGLVADVVELARGESPPTDHDDVAFDELVARAVERATRHWPAIEFRLTSEPIVVRGVAGRLDRAVANLLDNAGKFSPVGAPVDVTLVADGRLTVADRGPGVPDQALPHVFDRFFRADEARAMPGSGLGLAIAQQVAEGHGGWISLRNREGGGAVATLALPPLAGAVADRQQPAPDESTAAVPVPVEESLFH